MAGSERRFADVTSSFTTGFDMMPSMSSLLMEAVVTNHTITSYPQVTDKPMGEFADAKTALLINRIYVPILMSVGLVFNFLCFVTFIFTSLRRTSTCVYMAAIAVLDSVILGLVLCVIVSHYLGHSVFYMSSDWTCGLHYFLFYFSIHFDVLVLLTMTVDRFIVVKFPLKAQSLCTPKTARKVITGLGIFSFALNLQIFFLRRLVPTGNAEEPLTCWYPAGSVEDYVEKIYTVIDASIYSFIPSASLLTLNLLIIRQLKFSRKFSKQFTDNRNVSTSVRANEPPVKTRELKGSSAQGTTRKADSKKSEGPGSTKSGMGSTNINIMFLLVSFTFLVLTSPVVIVLLYKRYYWQPRTNATRARYLLILACVDNIMFSNHAFNFLLYCVSGRRFRQELKSLLAQFCHRF